MTRRHARAGGWALAAAAVTAVAGTGLATRGTGQPKPLVTTAAVTRGEIVAEISASGTLAAVSTVSVGSQVSGRIQALHADFNDVVRRGQVLAELDPSLLRAEVKQAGASLLGAEAAVERLAVERDAARLALDRTERLFERRLVAALEVEAAQVALRSLEADIRSAQASVARAKAALNQAQVNLAHTVIASPIDGTVISRAVEVGQTVAAGMSAPTLFTLAADLTRMRVSANIDESDVGAVAEGQRATFRVDAYPGEAFTGTVEQVRLEASTSQNVVTYEAIVAVDNRALKLKPGMTATVAIEAARRADALQVPNGALRVRPSVEALAALGVSGPDAAGWQAVCRGVPGCVTVWRQRGLAFEPVAVGAGITDGATTEVLGAALAEGDLVVTAIGVPSAAARTATASGATSGTANPLLGGQPRGPFPGGGPPPR
ncbi:MAG TPA: efflux RND transporter periplasmic adaptor subunit [Vicinamibacterales bacterium]|nr:efflux RND transporter periplasmic adaptor subunit [Vicinamibacterales bacterium]HPW21127.1 efflux RND transporter periplasmic adaptor subunit [Vicinamibacterales bacterium]